MRKWRSPGRLNLAQSRKRTEASNSSASRVEKNIFISLGANLGDIETSFVRASLELQALPDTEVTGKSAARLTRALGPVQQADFLNQVQRLSSTLQPDVLLRQMLQIESRMGRVRPSPQRWGPRVIDLDILFYGSLECESQTLILPHSQIWQRKFFLEMISEIDPEFLKLFFK